MIPACVIPAARCASVRFLWFLRLLAAGATRRVSSTEAPSREHGPMTRISLSTSKASAL